MVEAIGNQINTSVTVHFPVHLEPAVRVSNVLPKMLTVMDPPKLSPVVGCMAPALGVTRPAATSCDFQLSDVGVQREDHLALASATDAGPLSTQRSVLCI